MFPSAEYRFIDLMGNNDINTIDVSVYFKDKRGNLNPFILPKWSILFNKIII